MLRFTRGGEGDAVLVIHGLTTSTDMFIMPEHRNLVTCLLDEGYDVWCLDFRMSNRHSYNLGYHRYTLDDIALYDYPPAIELVRRHIGDRPLHVISHCLGSASFTMSLFGKAVDGISSLVANSVALTPRVPTWSRAKITVAPRLIELCGFQYVNPRWSEDPWLTPGKVLSKAVSFFHRECDVPACHMLSLMWGTGWPALYSHEKLDERTHRRGETPVLFTTGETNHVFTDSNVECHRRLRELGCTQHELKVFPGYGHQDPFMGKDVARDVFPHLLDFMSRHREGAPAGVSGDGRPAATEAPSASPTPAA
jgi:cholesterol oxidase